jgi:hypothetical protein
MKKRHLSFNIYFRPVCLILALSLALITGCATDPASKAKKEEKKEQSTIRLYIEGNKADAMSSGTVEVTRERFRYSIQRDPFLTEADLSKASFVAEPDGSCAIQLFFNDHGTLLLEMYTTDHPGKHIVVFSQFPIPGAKAEKERKKKGDDENDDVITPASMPVVSTNGPRQSAWLSAVLIRNRTANGLFTFTPDATPQECRRIVRGLQNVIAKAKKTNKF